MNLRGKAAIVTGGGTGVGRATALALARRGANVAINYSRSEAEAQSTVRELTDLGVDAFAERADVGDDAACRAFVDRALDRFGRLDILVNNAGTTTFVPHHQLDRLASEDWDRILSVNLKGPFQMTRAAAEALRRSGDGEVVMVSSIAGTQGIGSSIPYCTSKAALNMLTLTLSRVLAPEVRVNAVAPGFITGRWLREGFGAEVYEQVKEKNEARAPLGRVCDPEDVAAAILSLIEGPGLTTGHVVPVDGGLSVPPVG